MCTMNCGLEPQTSHGTCCTHSGFLICIFNSTFTMNAGLSRLTSYSISQWVLRNTWQPPTLNAPSVLGYNNESSRELHHQFWVTELRQSQYIHNGFWVRGKHFPQCIQNECSVIDKSFLWCLNHDCCIVGDYKCEISAVHVTWVLGYIYQPQTLHVPCVLCFTHGSIVIHESWILG